MAIKTFCNYSGPRVGYQPPYLQHRHKLAGTITVDGSPARRIVVVFDRRNMGVVATAVSDPITGAWEVLGLPEYPEKALFVAAFDSTGTHNAEVADYVSQVAAMTA